MVALKGDSDIGNRINTKVIQPLIDANSRLARSDFPDFDDSNKLGDGANKVEKLGNLIAIFENPALDFSKNRAEHDDILGDASEYLMRHFATESGKSTNTGNACHFISRPTRTNLFSFQRARNRLMKFDMALCSKQLDVATRVTRVFGFVVGAVSNVFNDRYLLVTQFATGRVHCRKADAGKCLEFGHTKFLCRQVTSIADHTDAHKLTSGCLDSAAHLVDGPSGCEEVLNYKHSLTYELLRKTSTLENKFAVGFVSPSDGNVFAFVSKYTC